MVNEYFVVDNLNNPVVIRELDGEFELVLGRKAYQESTCIRVLKYINNSLSYNLKVKDGIILPLKVLKIEHVNKGLDNDE